MFWKRYIYARYIGHDDKRQAAKAKVPVPVWKEHRSIFKVASWGAV